MPLDAATISLVMRAGVTATLDALDVLEAREDEVAQEINHDDTHRAARDVKVDTLVDKLKYLRVRIESDANSAVVKRAGIARRVPQNSSPVMILRYARAVLSALDADPIEIVPSLGSPYSAADIRAQLAPHIDDAEAAVEALAADTRETEQARRGRDEAQAHYARVAFTTAALIEAFCRQANMPDVAGRVRPNRRRISGRAEDDVSPSPSSPSPANVDTA